MFIGVIIANTKICKFGEIYINYKYLAKKILAKVKPASKNLS